MIVKWNLPRYLRQDQVRAFFSVIRNPRERVLFATIYLYGLRVSEACLLQREDVDFERRTIRVWRQFVGECRFYGGTVRGYSQKNLRVNRLLLDQVSPKIRCALPIAVKNDRIESRFTQLVSWLRLSPF